MDILWNVVWFAGIILFSSLVFFVFIPLAVYFNARADKQFTTVPEGEIKFIVEGDMLKHILVNIPGHYIKGEGLEAKVKKGESSQTEFMSLPSWLAKMFGMNAKKRMPIYYVGIDYPKTRVLVYEYVWEKLLKEEKGNKIEHRDEPVNSLYWRYPYPVEAKEVELKGNFKVDVTVVATVEIIRPYIPIFVLKGKWFSPLTAAIQGAITSYGGQVDFNKFREDLLRKDLRTKKGIAEQTPQEGVTLVEAIVAINDTLEETYGVKIIQVDFVSLEPSAGQETVRNALTAVEIAKQKAQAKREDALGDKDAAIYRREGEALGLQKLLEVANQYEGGVELLKADLSSKNLGQNSELTTLVLSGGGMGLSTMLPLSTEPKKNTDKKEEKKDDSST